MRRQRKTGRPSSVDSTLYVGYVEDGESVQAIMKKFEELDRMQCKRDGDICATDELSDAQLRELFIKTSAFTVRSANMVASGAAFDYDDEAIVGELMRQTEFASMGESDSECGEAVLSDDEQPAKRHQKRRENTAPKQTVPQPQPRAKAKIATACELKRPRPTAKRPIDPEAIVVLKLPDPITRSWALLIDPPPTLGAAVSETPSPSQRVLDIGGSNLVDALGVDWMAILMDPPFSADYPPRGAFARLALPSAVAAGMLFIWCETEHIADVVWVAETWGYHYVENAAWIKKSINNRIQTRPGPILARSHATLMIFRKNGDQQTIRHQRNPDCIFDFDKPAGSAHRRPHAGLALVEDMLPDAHSSARLLYLYQPCPSALTRLLAGPQAACPGTAGPSSYHNCK